MRILLTNDDGIMAAGIHFLARELQEAGHEIIIVAPERERSGASHSFTFSSPLRVRRAQLQDLPGVEAYAINGTPVDCVKLGCGNLELHPELVVSGVNHGQNMGIDVYYSGTVSAAMEAAMLHIPAMAASLCNARATDFSVAARVVRELLPVYLGSGSRLFNINVPDRPYAQLRGVRYTGLAHQEYLPYYETGTDPRGQTYYWCASKKQPQDISGMDTDERWVQDGFVAVTPLRPDFTDFERIGTLGEAEGEENGWKR